MISTYHRIDQNQLMYMSLSRLNVTLPGYFWKATFHAIVMHRLGLHLV